MLAYANEVAFYKRKTWENMVNAETAVQGVLWACYVGMVGLSCVTVHKWRMEKRRVDGKGGLGGYEELTYMTEKLEDGEEIGI